MIRALWTAASGMSAQQLNVDVISNNLANVNTSGFKKARAEFQDLFYQTLQEPQVDEATGRQIPVGIQIGMGTRPVAVQKLFSQGEQQQTDNPMDFAIEGRGHQRLRRADCLLPDAAARRLPHTFRGVTAAAHSLEASFVSMKPGTLRARPSKTTSARPMQAASRADRAHRLLRASGARLRLPTQRRLRRPPASAARR